MQKKLFVSLGGYLSDNRKTAVCHTVISSFSLISIPSEKVVYTGTLSDPINDRDSGRLIKIADFSDFTEEGVYCLKCGYRRSENFVISRKPYSPLKDLLRTGIYLNRCGYDFYESPFGEKYTEYFHRKCHDDFIPLYYGGQRFDVSGGWHEGSGYGKFVTVTASACAFMMYSSIFYPKSFSESMNDMPPILDECRWGLEWLLKMQAPDGRVYHKCDTAEPVLAPSLPAEDTEDYYIFPESYDAAVMFTAVTALGARVYENTDHKFSRALSRAASNSWLWIVNNPEYEPWKLPTGTQSGSIGDLSYESRRDAMFWMLGEMYSLTGNEVFLRRFEELMFFTDTTAFTLENTGGFGALAYLTGNIKPSPRTLFYLRKKFGDKADKIAHSVMSGTGYRTALGRKEDGYNALTNMTVISDCIICQTAYMIFGNERYRSSSAELFQYILGRNPSGISYITGAGENSPMRPAHAQSIARQSRPLPGMVVCGPNAAHTDEFSKWRLSSRTPPARCYIDNECSISTNAPSSAFGGAALMAAAFFDESGATNDEIKRGITEHGAMEDQRSEISS